MNPIHALMELEMQRWQVEYETNSTRTKKEEENEGQQQSMIMTNMLSAMEGKQNCLLKSLAQRFVYPASDYPPTMELVEQSDAFMRVLRDVVRRGSLAALYKFSSNACETWRCTCRRHRVSEKDTERSSRLPGRDFAHSKTCQLSEKRCRHQSAGDLSLVDVIGSIARMARRESYVGLCEYFEDTPSFEQWDAELQTAMRRVGDVVSQAHNEMLVALNALSDGRFPYLMRSSDNNINNNTKRNSTGECTPLWAEIVRLFEDAFESVLTDTVNMMLWCIHQHLMGHQGLTVRPLFTVKALWSYSTTGVVTSPSPSELYERLMRRVKKELIWIVVPEFRLSQMTKRPVPILGRLKRPMLRPMLMEDPTNKSLWDAIHYAASQRCDEIQEAASGLADTYSFYFAHEEDYYAQLGAQRLRWMLSVVRNDYRDHVQPVGAGAFAIQTELLQQVLLSKLEPALASASAVTAQALVRGEDGVTVARWRALMDVNINTSPAFSLGERLNAFRAGRKVHNKFDKGLEPVAHTARFLEEQRREEQRVRGERNLSARNYSTVTETKHRNDKECNDTPQNDNKKNAVFIWNNNTSVSPMNSSLIISKQPTNAPSSDVLVMELTKTREMMLSARGFPTVISKTTPSTCKKNEPEDLAAGRASSSLPQSSKGRMETSSSISGNKGERQLFRERNHRIPSSNPNENTPVHPSTEPATPSRRQERSSSVMNYGTRYRQQLNKERTPPTEPTALNRCQEQPSHVTMDASSCGEKIDTDSVVDTGPEPTTNNSLPSSSPESAKVNSTAAEMAVKRVAGLKKVCPFLPEMFSPGIFLEDMNLSDPRLEAAMNRIRAVRGNASVMRNYRAIAQVEDSLSVVIESLAEELCSATSRLMWRYPFLEGRVKGVLLANIPDLETDEDFQSLLLLRRDAERAGRPTASIDKCLRERAEELANDTPYVVEYSRYCEHRLVLTEPRASSDAVENEGSGNKFAGEKDRLEATTAEEKQHSKRLDEKTAQAQVKTETRGGGILHDESPCPPSMKEQPRAACQQPIETLKGAANGGALPQFHTTTTITTTTTTTASSPQKTHVTKYVFHFGKPNDKTFPSVSLSAVATKNDVKRTVYPTAVEATEEYESLPTTRLSLANAPSSAGKIEKKSEQVQPAEEEAEASSKPPVLSAVQESKENTAPSVYKPKKTSFTVPLEEKPKTTCTSQNPYYHASRSNNVDLVRNISTDTQPVFSDGLSFSTVKRMLENERNELEKLEAILEEVRGEDSILPESKEKQTVDNTRETSSQDVTACRSVRDVKQGAKDSISTSTLLSKSLSTFGITPSQSVSRSEPTCLFRTQPPGVTKRNPAPLGPLFEQRHSAPTSRGPSNGADSGECGELLRKHLEERLQVSHEPPTVKEQSQAIVHKNDLKRALNNRSPMTFNRFTDAVVRSSWGTVRNDNDIDQQQCVLPSLSRDVLRDNSSKQQQRSSLPPPHQQQSYGRQRLPWGRYTIQPKLPSGVPTQRRLSSAPDSLGRSDDTPVLFPAISSGSSADQLPDPPENTEWGRNTPNTKKGMSQQYTSLCKQIGIKPNSMLVRALPDTHGVSVTCIDTSVNYIGPKGLIPLLHVLRNNVGLEYLNLSHNNLENNEVIDLVNLLMTNSGASLQFLDLSNNPISLAGGAALLQLAQMRPSLISVRLKGTLVPQQISQSIQEICDRNCVDVR